MNNEKIKAMLRAKRIPYWRLGQVLGVHENTIVKLMRTDLSAENEKKVMDAIHSIEGGEDRG